MTISGFFLSLFYFILFYFERERERVQAGQGQRERGRHRIRSRLRAPSRQHRARRGARTHEPRDYDLSRNWTLNRRSHPGAPGLRRFKTETVPGKPGRVWSPSLLLTTFPSHIVSSHSPLPPQPSPPWPLPGSCFSVALPAV